MADVVLFHHVQGLTPGIIAFAETLRQAGHSVHTPDLFEGRTFDSIDDGFAYVDELGFETIVDRGVAAGEALGDGLVYGGFSMGVVPAQKLAQQHPNAKGALLFSSFVPVSEFGEAWPAGVPVQIHGKDRDPFFAGEGDIDAARALAGSVADAELFVYPGEEHLFADSSLPAYDEAAAALLTERVLRFLEF